jgi:hypothetical protein
LNHVQLVPQRQHFQLQDGARTRATSEGQQKREDDGHDGREAYVVVASKINDINGNGLFNRHRLIVALGSGSCWVVKQPKSQVLSRFELPVLGSRNRIGPTQSASEAIIGNSERERVVLCPFF